MTDSAILDRQSIRGFVSQRRVLLETAQASGTLARTKLDIKDEAESHLLSSTPEGDKQRWRSVLDEEVEAFCADMRMASMTVQQQVERRPRRIFGAICGAVGAFVVLIVILAESGVQSPLIGFGVPTLAALIAFFVIM